MHHTSIKHQLKILLILLIVAVSNILNAQEPKIEIKGLIIDEAKYPVPYVAVGIVKKHIGTASTDDGEFAFLISKNEVQDSLSISSLGYYPYKIKIEDFLNKEDKTIVLVETVTELNAVTLLTPLDYVENALKALKDNTISEPHQIDLLYRRATTEGNKAKFFVENFIKIRDRGDSNGPGILEVDEARKSADYRIWKGKQWQHSIVSFYNLNPLRPQQSQHKRNLKKFNWKKAGESSFEGEDVLIIKGQNPKINWEKIIFYIGVDSYKVYRIERGASLFIYKKHESGKLVISYFKNEWKLKKNMVPEEYKGTDAETSHYKTEAFVYNIETDKKKINVRAFGEDTDMGILELPYNSSFWKNLSMPPDTKFYRKIKSELESNFGGPLETQFELVNK